MKFSNGNKGRMKVKRYLSIMILIGIITSILPFEIKVNADENIKIIEDNTNLITDYLPTINELTDESGFKHPGVGLTKDILENMREQVREENDPWYTYYESMTLSSYAARDIRSSNESSSDTNKIDNDAFDSQSFNSRFISDGLKAYTQTLMYYITGDEVYRENAMHIIRIWSQMDPSKYKYFTDACIHTGIPLYRMVTAAEILRYSSCESEELKWTDKDTEDFTNNLITPVIETFQHDNNHFMNQHTYPLLGAMAGYIFTGNTERYEEAVEWFTVNKTAIDQGKNGSIKQLFRLVDTNIVTGEKLEQPVIQHVEMGRDQAHGGGDINNMAMLSRLLLAQDTKVDPVQGTISTNDEAVNPYEFLDYRILKAADFFWQYMLGYETPWIPVSAREDKDGNPLIIYYELADDYRGRMTTTNFWEIYYYYKYTLGMNMGEVAPYFDEAFSKRIPSDYYYQGKLGSAWESPDGGGDFWIMIPEEAAVEGANTVPKDQTDPALVELEERYTSFDENSATKEEGDNCFIEIKSTEVGSKIALLNLSYPDRTNDCIIGLKFRTNGVARVELSKEIDSEPYTTLTLPDTKGEWKYITYNVGISSVSYSQIDKNYSLVYLNVIGENTVVDIDNLNFEAGTQLTIPIFREGNDELNLFAYVNASIPIKFDFSATDNDVNDEIIYDISNCPEGAKIDKDGQFSWIPTNVGKYSFVVTASDGTSIETKSVTIIVTEDRKSIVSEVIAKYDENTKYEKVSLDNYKEAYNSIIKSINNNVNDKVFYDELSSLKNAVNELRLLTPRLSDGSIDYVNVVTSTAGNYTDSLTDNNNNSYPAYGLSPDFEQVFDFGAGFKVSAEAFEIQSRRSFPERGAGIAVFGSNDGQEWIRLTSDLTKVVENMQKVNVDDEYKDTKFRFIKMKMLERTSSPSTPNALFEVAEFRIYGERYELLNNKIEAVSLSSEQSMKDRIIIGDTIKLDFKATEEISDVRVKIQGVDVEVKSDDNINWTAELLTDDTIEVGKVKFKVNYRTKEGIDGEEVVMTTDNSSLLISDSKGLINDILNKSTVIDPTWKNSSTPRPENEKISNVKKLFDGDINTFSDFRVGTNGNGGYVTFDLGENNVATLSKIEILARQDKYYKRISGTVVQASNDNENWTVISNDSAKSTDLWQSLEVNSKKTYRYIRIYNSSSWFGNMAELRFYGVILNKSDLINKINEAKSIVETESDIYTDESINLLKEAIKAAEQLLIKDGLTQELINEAIEMVESTINELKEKVEEVDKLLLQELVNKVLEMDSSKYTSESWANLDVVLIEVNKVLQNENTTQEEVNELLERLQEAIKNLEERVEIIDKQSLQELVDKLSGLDSSKYTSESWNKLKDAIKNAKDILNNELATQYDVESALSILEKAESSLIYIDNNDSVEVKPDNDENNLEENSNESTNTDKKEPNLPKTGGVSGIAVGVFGLMVVATGLKLSKRNKN